jgi:beta-galactosidase
VLHVFPHWNWPGMEGQEIAVWVHSNLDRVELFLNGQSLGVQDVTKDSHLAWNVKYAPGAIEARGFKGGKQVLTAKRETAGQAAKLALTVDRKELSADGEDVAMFAVEVQDAQGRTMPTADNQVSFQLSGQGAVIGTGNGDPTSHEPDKGSSRKAFNGLCMAVVQATKSAGTITVEASAPGLTPASATVSTKAVSLRPQVAVWEREVPAGSGITGLWRTAPGAAAVTAQVFTFQQNGAALTGTVEGTGVFSRDGDNETPVAIEEGSVDGGHLRFRAGAVTYTGTLGDGGIEMRRAGSAPGRGQGETLAEPADLRPAIGPPPDGSDPSSAVFLNGGRTLARGEQTPASFSIVRAKR